MTKVWIAERADGPILACRKTAEGAIAHLRALYPDAHEQTPCGPYEEGEVEFFRGTDRWGPFALLARVLSYPVLD